MCARAPARTAPWRTDAPRRSISACLNGLPTRSTPSTSITSSSRPFIATFTDLRAAGCEILTVGQYLRPSAAHAPMARYYHPDEFRDLKQVALELGFVHVESGPLVRSSYHAHETADAYQAVMKVDTAC